MANTRDGLEKNANSLPIKKDEAIKDIEIYTEFSNAMLNRERRLLDIILPNKAERRIQEFQGKLIDLKASSHLEMIRMHQEFMRQAVKEVFDTALTSGKVESRKDKTSFFASELENLNTRIQDLIESYFRSTEEALAKTETFDDKDIQERWQRMLRKRLDEFETTVDTLMDRFVNIINEQV